MAIAWTTNSVERATKQLVKFGLVCQRSRKRYTRKQQTDRMDTDLEEDVQDNSFDQDPFQIPQWLYSEMRIALNFCESLSSIVHYHIIPSQWLDFMKNLKSSNSIEDVITFHGLFISNVLNELCLVQNETPTSQQQRNNKHQDLVRKAIVRGLDLCLQVSGIVTCILNTFSPHNSSSVSSPQQLLRLCQNTMSQFRDHLRYIVRLLTDVAFILEKQPLAELALKLNLNDYYKI